jgi:DNA primase
VGGDVIGFVVRFHQVSFPEALSRLAVRAGLELGELMETGRTDPSGAARAQGDELRGIATARFLPGRQAGERFAANGRRP